MTMIDCTHIKMSRTKYIRMTRLWYISHHRLATRNNNYYLEALHFLVFANYNRGCLVYRFMGIKPKLPCPSWVHAVQAKQISGFWKKNQTAHVTKAHDTSEKLNACNTSMFPHVALLLFQKRLRWKNKIEVLPPVGQLISRGEMTLSTKSCDDKIL